MSKPKMNYVGIAGIIATITLTLIGWGSSAVSKVDAKVDVNTKDIGVVKVDVATMQVDLKYIREGIDDLRKKK